MDKGILSKVMSSTLTLGSIIHQPDGDRKIPLNGLSDYGAPEHTIASQANKAANVLLLRSRIPKAALLRSGSGTRRRRNMGRNENGASRHRHRDRRKRWSNLRVLPHVMIHASEGARGSSAGRGLLGLTSQG
jgi:hypothetical protein